MARFFKNLAKRILSTSDFDVYLIESLNQADVKKIRLVGRGTLERDLSLTDIESDETLNRIFTDTKDQFTNDVKRAEA